MCVRPDDLPGVCVKNPLMKGMRHVDNMLAPIKLETCAALVVCVSAISVSQPVPRRCLSLIEMREWLVQGTRRGRALCDCELWHLEVVTLDDATVNVGTSCPGVSQPTHEATE